MMQHQAQAVEVAKLVPGHTTTTKVRDLGARVQQDREPEIRQLTELTGKLGTTSSNGPVLGTMSADDVAQLDQIRGQRFDSRWLDLMIVHNRGAILIAQTELTQGSNTEAKALAQRILDSRQAELDQMQGMTGG
jgi:uncharacterized protein (DUF305 family)